MQRINDEDIFNLTEDDLNLIENVVHPKKMSLEEALRSKDPLWNINNNISGRSKIQQTFRLLYAVILEVNSAGVSILFDRFSKQNIEKIYKNYSELKAYKLCAAIDSIKTIVRKQLGENVPKSKIQAFLNSTPQEIRTIDADKSIVNEMERVLLSYTKKFIVKLKD